jgi:hypothetical protein
MEMRTDAAAMSAPIIFASDNLIINEKWEFLHKLSYLNFYEIRNKF